MLDPTIYIKTAGNGNKWAIAFCPACGTPIYAAEAENPRSYSLRIGTLKERAQLPPKLQIWCDSAFPWTMELREVEASPGNSSDQLMNHWVSTCADVPDIRAASTSARKRPRVRHSKLSRPDRLLSRSDDYLSLRHIALGWHTENKRPRSLSRSSFSFRPEMQKKMVRKLD